VNYLSGTCSIMSEYWQSKYSHSRCKTFPSTGLFFESFAIVAGLNLTKSMRSVFFSSFVANKIQRGL
jgi:hypothetical protein